MATTNVMALPTPPETTAFESRSEKLDSSKMNGARDSDKKTQSVSKTHPTIINTLIVSVETRAHGRNLKRPIPMATPPTTKGVQ